MGELTVADELRDLIGLARQAIGVYGRDDLAAEIDAAVALTRHQRSRVVVVGNFKTGKSSLVNAIVNAPACAVDDDVATAVPTIVTHGAEPAAVAHLGGDEIRTVPIPLDRVAAATQTGELGHDADGDDTGGGTEGQGRVEADLRLIEISIPRRILEGGLDLVDTPGVGGITTLHQAATLSILPSAAAVLFVSDAARSYTARELEFVTAIVRSNPVVAAVVTKTDFHPHWRRIVAENDEHLRSVGDGIPVFPIATPIRTAAISSNDTDMNQESGYAPLIAWLQRIAANRSAVTAGAVAGALHGVFDELYGQLEVQRTALADPAGAEVTAARLEQAEAAAVQLRSASSTWVTKLNDGITDLTAEVDHDLRERMRERLKEAERRLGELDPATEWADYETWLTEGIAADVGENVELFQDHAEQVVTTVSELFDDESRELTTALPSHELTAEVDDPDFSKRSVMSTGLTALRGSYGGMLMFGMLANLAGIALLAPVAPVLGLFLGRKVVRDERERSLAQRRQQALQATRQYVDGISAKVNKDTRAAIRQLHRDLRNHFQERATHLQSSVAAAVAAARAEHLDDDERTRRIDALTGDLERLDGWIGRADDIVTRTVRSFP